MKFLNYFPALLSTVLLVTSCDDAKKDDKTPDAETTTVAKTDENKVTTVRYSGDGNRTVVTKTAVPAQVATTFEEKFVKADKVEWVKYDPIEEDNWDTDKDYYFANYEMDGIPYSTWYTPEGDWIKTTTPFKDIKGLPLAVSKAIADGFPGFEVVEIDKENDKNMDMYEVEMKKGEEKAKVKFLPNGDVFKAKVKS
ncbi:MAG: PepSY-like domain-containing protein [Rhizobacter sp.]|nr:PepSY-like domain-containing protein [Ferruginibacter sp.]